MNKFSTLISLLSSTSNYLFAGRVRSSKISNQKRYYYYDGHGSVIFLADADGNITDKYNYKVYGLLRSRSGSSSNPYQYSGERIDLETGLQYLCKILQS